MIPRPVSVRFVPSGRYGGRPSSVTGSLGSPWTTEGGRVQGHGNEDTLGEDVPTTRDPSFEPNPEYGLKGPDQESSDRPRPPVGPGSLPTINPPCPSSPVVDTKYDVVRP